MAHRNLLPRMASGLVVSIFIFVTLTFSPIASAHEITRVSVDSSGDQGNHWSYGPSISADGRFVAFSSSASNLVPGDTNEVSDIFVHDRQTRQTTRVSVDSSGNQGNYESYGPSISADGRFVAFSSSASNLVPGDTNEVSDIFVHDRQTGQTTRVSVDSSGDQGNGPSYQGVVSVSGRFVAFGSSASNLIPGSTTGTNHVFIHDRETGQTTCVSIDRYGNQGNGPSYQPSLSADGRFVAYYSSASNLISGDTNEASDIFVHDRATGETARINLDSYGNQVYGNSYAPSISSDGRFIAYQSPWNNTVPGIVTRYSDVYVCDRQTGETTRVSVSSFGTSGNSDSRNPSISADGRFVAFESYASNLVLDDINSNSDVFLHDLQTGKTTRVNVTRSGVAGTDGSFSPAISADGRYTTFHSWDSNLVSGDTNNGIDVFVYDSKKFNLVAYHLSTNRFLRINSIIWSGFGWDQENSLPLVWDYDGDGNLDDSLYHISSNEWFVRGYPGDNLGQLGWGGQDTIPVPGDYNGDGILERAFYHTPTNRWFVEGQGPIEWGWDESECIPLPGDYDGDGITDMMIYHIPTNQWLMFGVGNLGQYGWGGTDCIPVPADYDGDGAMEIAVYHVPSSQWLIKGYPGENTGQFGWGGLESFPIPGDYNADGATERAFYRPSENRWFVDGEREFVWGSGGWDFIPVTSQISIFNWYRFRLGMFQ